MPVGFWAFAAASYSNEAPFLSNTGTGQKVLSAEYTDPADPEKNVIGWIFDEKIDGFELRTRYPKVGQEFLATINPALFAPIAASAQAGTLFCDPNFVTPDTAAICVAVHENSPVAVFDQINDYPLEWCHSPEDATIPFLLTQIFLLQLGKPNVVAYEPLYPFMAPTGNHLIGQILCSAAVPTFLNNNADFLMVSPLKENRSGKVKSYSRRSGSGKRHLRHNNKSA